MRTSAIHSTALFHSGEQSVLVPVRIADEREEAMTSSTASSGHGLSLTMGGPMFELERRLHLAPPAFALRLLLASIGLMWAVPVLVALVELAVAPGEHTLLAHVGFHTRSLVGVPLLLIADLVLEQRVLSASAILVTQGVVPADDRLARWDRLVARVVRMRDTAIAEVVPVLFVAAVLVVQVKEILPARMLPWMLPVFHGAGEGAMSSPSWWWYVVIVQPVFLFLLLRWLWHWFLWSIVLVALAFSRLHLQATNPDRAGGIGFLASPLDAFDVAVLAVSVVLTGTWEDEIISTGTAAAVFAPSFLAMVASSLIIPLAPYVPLGFPLLRARRRGIAEFGGLARTYVDEFDEKWIVPARPPQLGTADLQALADLGTAFRVVDEMRMTVFPFSAIVRLFVVAVGPVLPLVLQNMSAADIAKRVFGVFIH
jgi:hypothetical protein